MYDMIYLLTAIGLTPGGSSTVHIYTQTVHRTTQNKQYIEEHNNLWECGPCPVLASFTLAFALQLRKKHGKTSVRVAASKNTQTTITKANNKKKEEEEEEKKQEAEQKKKKQEEEVEKNEEEQEEKQEQEEEEKEDFCPVCASYYYSVLLCSTWLQVFINFTFGLFVTN